LIRLASGAALAVALLSGVVACDAARDATDTVGQAADKASICVEALRLAGVNPDPNDPAKAVEEAKKTSDELERLAGQTPDETLRTALNDMSRTVEEFRPENAAQWARDKVDTLDRLTRACA
jgi:hypothetical protein